MSWWWRFVEVVRACRLELVSRGGGGLSFRGVERWWRIEQQW